MSRTPVFYTWTENQAGRGAVCVGSAPKQLKQVELYFPARCLLPADRDFGRVEKDLRKNTSIFVKEDNQKFVSLHGQVRKGLAP